MLVGTDETKIFEVCKTVNGDYVNGGICTHYRIEARFLRETSVIERNSEPYKIIELNRDDD